MTTQRGKKWKEHAPQAGAGEGTRNREGGERRKIRSLFPFPGHDMINRSLLI